MKIILIFIEVLFLIFGSSGFIWGIFCFFGGPDGKFGSLEAFYWSIGFLTPSIIILFCRKKLKAFRLRRFN
jgi:hypothetical protein